MKGKKLPGVDWIYLVYDNRNRLVASQDGVQRAKIPDEEWAFTKYDALNRPIMTGIYKVPDGTSPDAVQATVTGFSVFSEDRLATGYGYTNNSFPKILGTTQASITESDILTLTYYDTYEYPGAKAFDNSVRVSDYINSSTGSYYFDRTKGQVTGTRLKVLDGTENNATGYRWLISTSYYDDHYRAIQILNDLYSPTLADNQVASMLYDFTGKVLNIKTRQVFNAVTTTVDKYYSYNHAGLLTKTDQQITGDANGRVTVAENTYNEIGQLIDKKLHKAGSFNYLQSIDYSYNIRGWLTSINNPDNLTALQAGDPNIDLFGEKLLYETTEAGLNNTYAPQFNGNISAMAWNTTLKMG